MKMETVTGLLSAAFKTASAGIAGGFSYLAALGADQWYLEPYVKSTIENPTVQLAAELGTAVPILAAPFVGGWLGWKGASWLERKVGQLTSRNDQSDPQPGPAG